MSLIWAVVFAAATTMVFVDGTIFYRLRGPSDVNGEAVERDPSKESWALRTFRDLVGCPLCSGVWIGWAWAAFALRDAGWTPDVCATIFGAGPVTALAAQTVKQLWDVLERWG